MLCPCRPNTELVSYCQSQGIIVTAYSPLGRGLLIDNPVVKAVSQTEGKTPSQVRMHVEPTVRLQAAHAYRHTALLYAQGYQCMWSPK